MPIDFIAHKEASAQQLAHDKRTERESRARNATEDQQVNQTISSFSDPSASVDGIAGKRARALKKKLKEIGKLEVKQQGGAELDQAQLAKLNCKIQLQVELDQLNWIS